MTTQPDQAKKEAEEESLLSAGQMEIMINIDSAAEQADKDDDFVFFDNVVASEEWKTLFGGMSWDQTYDRYEIIIGRCTDC